MDCRTFHRKLEDYLEGGLDFSGRFGMERHAQQCLGCGKEMADALELRRMVSAMSRVKAPGGFENSVLREIAAQKASGRHSGLRRLWIHGFEWRSFRNLAMASASLVILVFAISYMTLQRPPERVASVPRVASEIASVAAEVKEPQIDPVLTSTAPVPKQKPAAVSQMAKKSRPVTDRKREDPAEQELKEAEYLEYMMTGPDNRSVPVRLPLPKVIPVRYGQISEDYFIQNVSH